MYLFICTLLTGDNCSRLKSIDEEKHLIADKRQQS
jgi:hypothetical protein